MPAIYYWKMYSIKMNKTNRCTEFQLHWYDNSTCFGQPFCPSSGVLNRTSALVHYMQLWWPYAIRSRMTLQCHPTPGSIRSPQLHMMYQSRCMVKNSWWWAERLPETCRIVIPMKLEFSASVRFIHFNLLRCTVMRTNNVLNTQPGRLLAKTHGKHTI
jgi:hypothetical protein